MANSIFRVNLAEKVVTRVRPDRLIFMEARVLMFLFGAPAGQVGCFHFERSVADRASRTARFTPREFAPRQLLCLETHAGTRETGENLLGKLRTWRARKKKLKKENSVFSDVYFPFRKNSSLARSYRTVIEYSKLNRRFTAGVWLSASSECIIVGC